VIDVIAKHLEAIGATVALLQAQIQEARIACQLAAPRQIPKVQPLGRLPQCDGVPDVHCARLNEDARISKASFGNPTAAECKGCGAKVDLALTA
jgi:hypothetical protein